MESRLRENPKRVFECFCEVVIPSSSNENCWILQKFPDSYNNEEMLKSIIEFSYPCEFTNIAIQHFSFVLTSIDSKWTFGYCRHTSQAPNFFVVISCFPWHETFCMVLNHIADLTEHKDPGDLWKFLQALYNVEVPEPGMKLHVAYNQGKSDFIASTPDHHKLSSIPEDRNLTEYFSAISVNNMMTIFASMLNERRILFTSKKLSQLSACVQAANTLIYPMCWQHIFIPVLPKHLLDYVSAPMPFLIGIPSSTMSKVNTSELGEVVILYVDINKVETCFNDLESLPSEIVQVLKKSLKHENILLGDGLARAFLRALVQLIGGYREALRVQLGEKITFNSDAFIQTRPISMQPFLERMLHLQIFQQFIDGRLEMLNSGQGFSDEFELEVNMYEEKSSSSLKTQYKEWVQMMKKEGGAFFKTVKHKVKDKSKRAYKDLRSRLHDMQIQKLKNVKEETMKSAIEELKTTKAFRHTRIQHYNLLNPEEGMRDSEDSVSDNESSSNFRLQRLDMDLMGDLQDLIFRRCSISLTEECTNADGNVQPKVDTTLNQSTNTTKLPPPIPAPRTKRTIRAATTNGKVAQNTSSIDTPLINLDLSEDIFDPLQEGYKEAVVDNKSISSILNTIPTLSSSPTSQQSLGTFLDQTIMQSPVPSSSCNSYSVHSTHQPHSSNQIFDQRSNMFAASSNPFIPYQPVDVANLSKSQDTSTHKSNITTPTQDSKSMLVLDHASSTDDPFADLVNWQVSNLSKASENKSVPSSWEQFQ
ncbi:DENN domain-containing protein 1A-like isoform X2 [Centruroides vittatus]|uniref:DENN domain-containing protein 1A-like isoform X2 n=1 Tax=Centruroides vittatus TaxID=120091 RepID=UPI0035109DD3